MVPASVGWLDDIGRGARESFFMFWETLWPLILGFGIAGVVQAFVGRESMRARLGTLRPSTIARATGYGMVSSSCSYAAAAMAKSLFAKGADFVAASVFMFASTNLVIELGVVLVVLLGWQFAASEFVGGVIMIVLLSLAGSLWLRGRVVVDARVRLAQEGGTDNQMHGADNPSRQRERFGSKLRSKADWANAATYTMADLTMLRRELLLGFTVAGFLATLVPTQFWNLIFLHGHGFWTSAENVLVGPFVAVISFVCSIGNVPLAAALWKGGISFGGVIAFVFADLIALPLLFIYRRYYGTRLTLRMLGIFWAVMSIAGLATEGIFRSSGLVPVSRPMQIAPDHFSWGYTTYLNLVFLALFGLLYWAYRNRERLGGGRGYTLDPVCGMQIETTHAPVSVLRGGQRHYFCSDRCRERFDRGGAGATGDRDPTGARDRPSVVRSGHGLPFGDASRRDGELGAGNLHCLARSD
jgi:hypothetical protein